MDQAKKNSLVFSLFFYCCMKGEQMFTNKKLNTYKIQLNEKENTILDEICEHSRLTKSDAISRALKYYYDDQCPCSTDRKDILDKASKKGYLNGFEFSILIQNLLISENGYVIDTGNWENVNAEIALRLAEQIKKHPIIWKLFFMVA